ncbi:DEAD/DEAH box helicase [Segnochrobactraceae bacterium EtOH-i3]
MTTSLPSPSDPFERLHPGIRRWIWQQGWGDLRPVQRAAIPPLIDGDRDVIVAARTAGGKTEAAFLPLLSRIADEPDGGFRILYVSPLKALINDQFRRLDLLCEALDVPVFRWHGDVSASHKKKARERPAGVLLMTPESLEATFVRRGPEIPRLFGALDAIVIDELHAFLASARGRQLQSLLHRIEVATRRRVTRVGLSATLGDMRVAADFLRPGEADRVALVEDRSASQTLRLQLLGYVQAPLQKESPEDDTPALPALPDHHFDDYEEDADAEDMAEAEGAVEDAMCAHLFRVMRGGCHLIFAGRRSKVESMSDRLRQRSEDAGVPNEFFPHHANLARDHRAFVEDRLRDGSLPTTAVCTSTLELGIDIGDIRSVAQIGPPFTVASLNQRMGRSGRRPGQPTILRLYVSELELTPDLALPDALRFDLVQATAMVHLLMQRWVEAARPEMLDLSTLVHQTLALIAERGGIHAAKAYEVLCRTGPFARVSSALYIRLLRAIGRPETDLIVQSADGTLLLGKAGERLVDHYEFYAVFETATEYRVVHAGQTLGTMPVLFPLVPEMTIIFSGRRWEVKEIVDREKLITVAPSSAGLPPSFGGHGGDLDDLVVAAMRAVYLSGEVPVFLDEPARALLAEARDTARRLDLSARGFLTEKGAVWLFPWVGTVKLNSLSLALTARGFKVARHAIALEIERPRGTDDLEGRLRTALAEIAAAPAPDALTLAAAAENRQLGKYDPYLTDELLLHSFASQRVAPETLPAMAAALLGEPSGES